MTQAGVDLHLNGDGELLQNSQPSRRHKYTDDYGSSQDDEDPSWLPGEPKQKKKRRHHRQRDLRAHRALEAPELLHRHDTPTQPSSSYSRPSSSNVSVELTEDCDIAWEDFRPLGTEMIICKEGRFVSPSSIEVAIASYISLLSFIFQENVSIGGGDAQWAGARQRLLCSHQCGDD